MIQVAVLNNSTVVNDDDVPAVVAALQKQVSNEFAAAWGIDATLTFVPKGTQPDPAAYQLVILDDSDQAGALGYHDTTPAGLPQGLVFAKTTQEDGGAWTVTASHELLEMLVDPEINLTVFAQRRRGGYLFSYEVCDACEGVTYMIDGIQVSDFVLPSYFEKPNVDNVTPAGPFDHMGQLPGPVPTLLPGGYIGVYHVGMGGGWRQITASEARHSRVVPPVGSRRHKRTLLPEEWRRSVH